MMEPSRLRIFISYSGARSRVLAFLVRDMMAQFLSRLQVTVYGPESGSRHLEILGGELELSLYGIFCVTPENLYSPWLHFEAGAISKMRAHSRAVPLLFALGPSSLPSPLSQFGARVASADGVADLLQDIAREFGQDLPERSAVIDWWKMNVEPKRSDELAEPTLRVDEENPLHARIRRFGRTIQSHSTNFRVYLGREILSRTHDAMKEIAEQLTPIRTAEEFISRVGTSLRGAISARALCGGKPWGPRLRDAYYQQCYEFAKRRAQKARSSGSPVRESMVRVFVRALDGSWNPEILKVIQAHHERRADGVIPLFVTTDADGRLPQIPRLSEDIVERGFGFIIVKRRGERVAFVHRGGEAEPFRAGEFHTEYALHEISRLFRILRQNSEEFAPELDSNRMRTGASNSSSRRPRRRKN